MSLSHGVYIQEMQTPTTALTQIDSGVIVAVGTAPIQQKSVVLCNNLTEFVQNFGGGEGFTLKEVANCVFGLYNISPVIFINVFNPEKHFTEKVEEYEGQTQFRIEDANLISDSIKITSGEKTEPNVFTAADYTTVGSQETEIDDDTGEEITVTIQTLTITNAAKVVDGKIKLKYKLTDSDEEIETEVTLNNNSYVLPENIDVNTIKITSGGVDTLTDLHFTVTEFTEDSTFIVEIIDTENIIGDKVKLSYKVAEPSKVTAAEIIGGVNAANGEKYGLELIDAVPAKLGLNSTFTIIAPGFSEIPEVAAALAAKAKGLIFPSIAIADIDSEDCKTYQAAVEWKTQHGLANPFLIYTYPKVILGDTQYYLSTHLAAVMNLTDADNNFLPYVSPSNQRLQISGAVLADGTEVYYDQNQANALNEVGIVTAFNRNGWRVWGNYTSVGDDTEYTARWISVRRMLNFIETYLDVNYFSNLDAPINRRNIDAILQSANLYLASLQTQGAILGAELTFDESENSTESLMAGKLTFNLKWLSPPPAQAIIFKIQVDTSYFSNLFA